MLPVEYVRTGNKEVIFALVDHYYYYYFRCYSCGNKSKRLSRFYELDLNIQGHSSLHQCIKEFLKVTHTFLNYLNAILL